jgi:hypothetical protein
MKNVNDLNGSGCGLIEVLFWDLPGESEENQEKSQCSGRDLNGVPHKYESTVLMLRQPPRSQNCMGHRRI